MLRSLWSTVWAVTALLAAPAHANEVVLFCAVDARLSECLAIVDAIRTELASASDGAAAKVELEFVDPASSPQAPAGVALAAYLRAKYRQRPVDVAVAISSGAIDFLLEQPDLFAGRPAAVLVGHEHSVEVARVPPGAALIEIPLRPAATVELAASLQPGLEHVFVLTSALDGRRERAIVDDLGQLAERFDVQYLVGFGLDDLLDRVSRLPRNSMLLYDSTERGGLLDAEAAAERLAEAANAPLYTLHEHDIGRGAIGGYVTPVGAIGAEAARLVLRQLHGAGDTTTVTTVRGSLVVDAAAMRQQGFAETRLPASAEQRFGQSSVWRLYQGWIVTLLVLAALQFVLVGAFLIQSIQRRKDRVALNEAAYRFQLARIAGQVGFWQWDLASNEWTAEPELRRLLGFDGASAPSDWCAYIHCEDRERVSKAAENYVQGFAEGFDIQHRVKDHYNRERWFLSRGQLLRGLKNQPTRLVGMAIDITERKRQEDDRARAQLELHEQRVELAHLGRAAAAGALSGALAHELKQPLSAILMNAQAGQDYITKPNADYNEVKAILADIEGQCRRAGEIIRNLRNLLRPGEEHFAPVHIFSVVNDVLTLLHSDLVARNVRVAVAPMTGVPAIIGERVQLQQVMLNVINNAIDAMSNTDPRERCIEISATTDAGRVHISVADTGCGLGTANADEIFKPFVSTKRHGLGLGLTLSRSIVDRHGGRIWASSNTDRGTTVHMEFPVETAEIAAA
ncbi:MAG TPA: ATP-binding protein [Gammaproteobacteria bacterium]|nr:ATP-binding protein [Gammaproteobacteria bacterium]